MGQHSSGDHHPLGPTGAGSVVLDIGGNTGALVVHAPPGTVGAEIDIRRVGSDWTGDHTAVRERQVKDAVFCAGLFAPLESGEYQVRWRGPDSQSEGQEVSVQPGRVTEAQLGSAGVSPLAGPGSPETGPAS